MTPAEKIKKLTADILAWDDAYYGSGATPVSDAVYDAAKMQLKELETQHPDLQTPDSPTLTIGKPRANDVGGRLTASPGSRPLRYTGVSGT